MKIGYQITRSPRERQHQHSIPEHPAAAVHLPARARNNLLDFPNEIILDIASHLELHSLSKFLRSCRRLYALIIDYLFHRLVRDSARSNITWTENRGPYINFPWLQEAFRKCMLDGRGKPINAMCWAVTEGHIKVVASMIDAGVDVNAYWDDLTPLHMASANGDEAMVRFLLDNGADINRRVQGRQPRNTDSIWNESRGGGDVKGSTALHLAVRGGQLKFWSDNVYNEKLPTFFRSPEDVTPGHEAVVRLLLARGIDIEAINGAAATPLHVAASYLSHRLIAVLLEHGARVDVWRTAYYNGDGDAQEPQQFADYELQWSPLHAAAYDARKCNAGVVQHSQSTCECGDPQETVKLLLKSGLDINLPTHGREGMTPLHLATEACNLDMIRVLLEHGADINATCTPRILELRDGFPVSALDIACVAGSWSATMKLRETPVHKYPGNGWEYFVQYEKWKCIKMLLEAGAKATAGEGPTLLRAFLRPVSWTIAVKLLLEHGVDPNVTFNSWGDGKAGTLLYWVLRVVDHKNAGGLDRMLDVSVDFYNHARDSDARFVQLLREHGAVATAATGDSQVSED